MDWFSFQNLIIKKETSILIITVFCRNLVSKLHVWNLNWDSNTILYTSQMKQAFYSVLNWDSDTILYTSEMKQAFYSV